VNSERSVPAAFSRSPWKVATARALRVSTQVRGLTQSHEGYTVVLEQALQRVGDAVKVAVLRGHANDPDELVRRLGLLGTLKAMREPAPSLYGVKAPPDNWYI